MSRFIRSILPIAILTSFLLIAACGGSPTSTSQKSTPTKPPAACHATGTPTGPAGTITAFALPAESGILSDLTAGPDGNLWFTANTALLSGDIGRLTPDGQVTLFPLKTHTLVSGITTGPDGNLWFGEMEAIGRITPAGQITHFPLPGMVSEADGANGLACGGSLVQVRPFAFATQLLADPLVQNVRLQ